MPLGEFRPLVQLSVLLNYAVSGIHPLGYHLTSIFQHVLSSLLVFLIAKSAAGGPPWRAGFAGLLFAVLPVQSDTICWISGSESDGLATVFYLAAFLCFVRFRTTGTARYLVLSAAAFVGSLLSKEIALTLPLMLLSYDLFRRWTAEKGNSIGSDFPGNQRSLSFILPCIPFALLLLAYLGLRRIALSNYLLEDRLSPHLREALANQASFQFWFDRLLTRFLDRQAFNLRELLLPFGTVALGIILGFCLAWAVSFFLEQVGVQ
ncbi:MAG: glycosyltransferase family 39 protein [Acidobacteria bacterium]|nr:glycosyltransferase family 39 protein [Acidobacteriota bacterium]